jgi:hypothetical protein
MQVNATLKTGDSLRGEQHTSMKVNQIFAAKGLISRLSFADGSGTEIECVLHLQQMCAPQAPYIPRWKAT